MSSSSGLEPVVDRVIVCDRRGETSRGNKADQPDADLLSDLLRHGTLRAVYHGSQDRATLKELARTYQNLVEDSTRVMQRLKALFRRAGSDNGHRDLPDATARAVARLRHDRRLAASSQCDIW